MLKIAKRYRKRQKFKDRKQISGCKRLWLRTGVDNKDHKFFGGKIELLLSGGGYMIAYTK